MRLGYSAGLSHTIRLQCNNCNVEFELIFEPKCAMEGASSDGLEDVVIRACPFCKSYQIEQV